MPANTAPIFPLVVQTAGVAFANADGTTAKTLVTAGSNGTRVDAISAVSDDTSARTFTLSVHDGSTNYPVGEIVVAAGAGTDGSTLAIKGLSTTLLPWLDASGSLFLKASWTLRLAAKVAVTSGKTVTFVAFSGDY